MEHGQPQRDPAKGRWVFLIGFLLFLAGSISMLLLRYGSNRPDNPLFFYIGALVITAVGIRLVIRGRKLQTKDALEIIREKQRTGSERPTFLYLRSFQLDADDANQTIPMPGGLSAPIHPWESGLTSALKKVGDVVAIGRPGEKLATIGAQRFYPTNEEWQDKISELTQTSELVFWTYGETDGLLWEINHLEQSLPPEKLILAFPFWDKTMKKRREIWNGVLEKMSGQFPHPLPEKIEGNSLFIGFDKDWNASWFPANPPALPVRIACLGFWSPISKGIESVLTARGFHYPPLSSGEKWLYAFFALLGWIVVSVLLVMMYGLYVAFFH